MKRRDEDRYRPVGWGAVSSFPFLLCRPAFEAVQRGELTIQELFLGGKLKMEGDYSLALQLSMQLLTNPL